MSKMIPQLTINNLRDFVDISLDNYGIDCDLYVPTNTTTVEQLDAYVTPDDFTYIHYTAKVLIEWNINIHRLRALGLFIEGELPIFVYLPNNVVNDSNIEVAVDILKGSYIKVALQYIPNNTDKNDEFELTDIIIKNMHDAVAVKRWKAVPRRV